MELPLLLVVEDEWRGHPGALRLTLADGGGRVRAEATLGAAARQAAELAVAAVLGRALPRWDVTLDVRAPEGLPAHIIDGDSLGLLVAVACRAAGQGLGVPARTPALARGLSGGGLRPALASDTHGRVPTSCSDSSGLQLNTASTMVSD